MVGSAFEGPEALQVLAMGTAMGPAMGQLVFMPAMQPVMWNNSQYAPSNKELEEMLKQVRCLYGLYSYSKWLYLHAKACEIEWFGGHADALRRLTLLWKVLRCLCA